MENKAAIYKNNFIAMLTNENIKVYFFGAGEACGKYLESFIYKDKIDGIYDNDNSLINKKVENIKVLDKKYLAVLDKKKTGFIVTTGTPESFYAIKKQLKMLGFENVISCLSLLDLSPGCELIGVHGAFHEEEIKKVEQIKLFLDKKSQYVVDRIVKYRKNQTWDYHEIMDLSEEQYFDGEIINLDDHEIFIDAGAYIGDTLATFIKRRSKWEKIYCFEPDEKNYVVLSEKAEQYQNVKTIKAAVGRQNGEASFCFDLKCGSHLSDKGQIKVDMHSIDSLHEAVTFIKMDIEGGEIEAIWGAKETIQTYKPKLAICLYHKPNDLWEIPLLIKKLVPEYQIYIRHYSEGVWDTIMYAVIK